jgi:hypothetical protein
VLVAVREEEGGRWYVANAAYIGGCGCSVRGCGCSLVIVLVQPLSGWGAVLGGC